MAYNSSYTGPEIDSAIGAVKNKEKTWDSKQDKLTGTAGQVVGFNASGNAQAQEAPDPLPSGGTEGQILTLGADGAEWADAPATGVTSFKGRTGAITPQAGDYTAEMVGAVSEADVGVANGVATLDASGKLTATQKPTYTADEVGARPNTWTPTASDVGAVPTTRTINSKPLSSNVTLTADDVGAANPPTLRTATLTASGWSSNSQTVTVTGVVANNNAQAIDVSPLSKTDADNWAQAGVWCTAQGANTLTFTCTEVPSANINVNVKIQEV